MQTFRKKFFKKIRTYFFCIDYQQLAILFEKNASKYCTCQIKVVPLQCNSKELHSQPNYKPY